MRAVLSMNGPIFKSGESHDLAHGVITERMHRNGSLAWEEDDAPDESRFRRAQQVVSPAGRTRRGAPPDLDDDGEEMPRARRRFNEPARRWWKPASTVGRVFLGLGLLAVVGGLVTAWIAAKRYLEHEPHFAIRGSENIQSTGLSEVSRNEMLPVFGEDIGRNIFLVNLNERRKALEQIPWIQSATVMRLLPDQLRVNVVERTPIAFVRQGQQIGLVDADGVLLTMPAAMMTLHHYSFPVVTGIDAGDPQQSRRARMAVYQRLIHDLDANGQRFSEQISEIDLTDPEDARVLMPEQGGDILAHFGDDQFMARYQRYKAHIAEWRQQYPRLAAVDLRYDQQVVLQMKPGAGAPTATTTDDGQPVQGDAASAAAKPKTKPVLRTVAAKKPVAKAAAKKKPRQKQGAAR